MLTLFLFLSPVADIFAQSFELEELPSESEVSDENVDSAPQEIPIDPTGEEVPEEIFPDAELPKEELVEEVAEEKLIEEVPLEEEMMLMSEIGGAESTSIKFQLSSQPRASVDQSTGALIYEYPIRLPEGRVGMTPELFLKYNSRNATKPDSITGLGWEVSIPYIVREPVKGTNNLYTQPYFNSSISGNLIATTDASSSPYTVYRPEVDNGDYFKYVFNTDNSWTVSGKDGKTFYFGVASSSRQDNPSDSTKIYKWMLTKITDTHGNEIAYTYTKNGGQIYPDGITYTNYASSTPMHTVAFTYTTPTNYGSVAYNSGFAVTVTKLLNTIKVTTPYSSSDSTKDTYTLNYNDAQFLKQKLLTSIERSYDFAAPEYNQSFNDTTSFTYSSKTGGWEAGTHSLAGFFTDMDDTLLSDTYISDFDANGYPDVFYSNRVNNTYYTKLLLNSGTTFVDETANWSVATTSVDYSEYYAIVDLNGDRLPDLHPRQYTSNDPTPPVYINNGNGFDVDTSGTWLVANYSPDSVYCGLNVGDGFSYSSNTFLYDINRDGLGDIVRFSSSSGVPDFEVYLNDGNGWTVSNDYTFTQKPGATYDFFKECQHPNRELRYQTLVDVNGDGLEDFVHFGFGTYLNTGSGFAYSAAYTLEFGEANRTGLADINGDGLLDFTYFKWYGGNKCVLVYINNGNGFTLVNPSSTTSCNATTGAWDPSELLWKDNSSYKWGTLIDVTSDGYPDALGVNYNNTNFGRLRAINDSKGAWVVNPGSGDTWTPLINISSAIFFDVNADGIVDYITPNTGWNGSSSLASKVYIGKSSVPNRLTQITNSLGAQTVVEYSTAPTNYSDTDIAPTPIVSKVTLQNLGHGQPSMVTRYEYDGGEYVFDTNTSQRRFAGFHQVTTKESGADLTNLRTTETYFHQANGSDAGTDEATDTKIALIGKPYYVVVKDPEGSPKKEVWNKYDTHTLATEPMTDRIAEFVYPTEIVTRLTDSSTTTASAMVYNFNTAIGEKSEERDLGFVTASNDGTYIDIAGDTRYKFIEYATSTGDAIVKLKRIDLRASSSTVDTVTRTDYFYDNQSHGVIGSLGNLTKETKWISGNGDITGDTTYTYDTYGNILSVTNPRNAVTTYGYDSENARVISLTNHLGQTTAYEYKAGKLTKITDPNGRITSYGYSNKGWLYRTTIRNTAANQRKIQWLDTTSSQYAIESYTQLVNVRERQAWDSFDRLGRPVRVVERLKDHENDIDGDFYLKSAKTYDVLGREVTASAPYGTPNSSSYSALYSVNVPGELITTTNYDAFDRPLSVENAIGTTSYEYTGNQMTVTDGNGNEKIHKTDAHNNLVEVQEIDDSNIYTTTYDYDVRNLLTGLTDALGNIRTFTYNNAGWLTKSEDLHASIDTDYASSTFTYDVNGNQLTETQPNGTVITREFDILDRPTSIDGSTTGWIDHVLSYDSCTNGKGYLCSATSTALNSVTLNKSYAYGLSGKPTSVTLTTLGNSYTTSYLYNYGDDIKQVTYPNGTIVRTLFGDWAKPEVVYVTLPGGSETAYAVITRDHTEKPTSISITNGPVLTYDYDEDKLYRLESYSADMGTTTLQSYVYEYDDVGNILEIEEPTLLKEFAYDDLNRLTDADYTLGTTTTSYDYDYSPLGNITAVNGVSYAYSGTGKTNPHAVTEIASSTYAYDDNGNMTTAPNLSLIYNWQNQPVSIVAGGSTSTAAYDETGDRFLYQTASTTEIQVTNEYLLRDSVPEISLNVEGIPLGVVSSSTIYATIADHLGTPVKQINSSGVITEETTYDPFGSVLTHSGSDFKRGYIGEEYDEESNLSYLNARYYDGGRGQFLSQDPSFLDIGSFGFEQDYERTLQQHLTNPQALNSYSYALNNPIRYSDPEGEIVPLVIGAWALAEIGLSAYDVYSTGRTLFDESASLGEKLTSGGLTLAGFALPGSGYGKIDDAAGGIKNLHSIAKQSDWNNSVSLVSHTLDHAKDFGLKTTDYVGYAQAANSFYKNTKTTERFVGNDGAVRVYDKSTNTFGSYTKDGKTKTFFKPDRGAKYWKSQKKKYGKK